MACNKVDLEIGQALFLNREGRGKGDPKLKRSTKVVASSPPSTSKYECMKETVDQKQKIQAPGRKYTYMKDTSSSTVGYPSLTSRILRLYCSASRNRVVQLLKPNVVH